MEQLVYLMEYHRILRAKKEESYQKCLSTLAVTEVMDSLSVEIRRLRWM